MSSVFSYDFENGTNGTTISTANSNFNNLVSNWTFSNAHPILGTLAGRVSPSATTAIANGVPGGFTATPTFFVRFYLYPEVLPGANTTIFQFWRNGSGQLGDIQLSSTGAVRIRHSGLTLVAASGNLATAGTPVRIEGGYNATAGTYQLKVFAGANVNGATPDYDSGALTGTTNGNVDSYQIGVINSATTTLHFDNIAMDNAVFPGSAVTATGRAKVWTGTQWKLAPVKVWTGSTWKTSVAKVWTGSAWKVLP